MLFRSDGVSTITVEGQAIFTAGAFVPGTSFATAYGTLTITGFTPTATDDIGDVICFLLSDASRWLTGQTLHANGGVTMV